MNKAPKAMTPHCQLGHMENKLSNNQKKRFSLRIMVGSEIVDCFWFPILACIHRFSPPCSASS